jgi:chromosome segregation ATPase
MLELYLQDKDVEVEDLKTRIDVVCLDNKQEKENQNKRVDELKQEIKNTNQKVIEAKRHAGELQATLVSPSDFKCKQEELHTKSEEITRLKAEIRRLNDSLYNMKNEKLDMVKKMSVLEDVQTHSTKNNEETNKLRAEISRKEKTIQTLRMNVEELKTEREMYLEQSRTVSEKFKQTKIDLERKEKVVYEWKSKYDNLLEKSSLELTDVDMYQKQAEKLNDKIKKQKAELDRKDTTLEVLKSKLKVTEDGSKDFEHDIKEKQ